MICKRRVLLKLGPCASPVEREARKQAMQARRRVHVATERAKARKAAQERNSPSSEYGSASQRQQTAKPQGKPPR
jgi:hypothetical protein